MCHPSCSPRDLQLEDRERMEIGISEIAPRGAVNPQVPPSVAF